MYQDWVQSPHDAKPLIAIEHTHRRQSLPPKRLSIDRHTPLLQVSAQSISQIARMHSNGNLLMVVIQQALSETMVRVRRKAAFRKRRNSDACQAYCRMSVDEFKGINARQCWANWRTIPRNLNSRIPNHPIKIIDLCCGIGESTEVLAYYAAPGSEIIGYEYNPEFVALARKREFLDDRGDPCRVRFRTQSVLETFCWRDHQRMADGSIDLVNSSGAVGCHFDVHAAEMLAREICRVLRSGGLAMIDSGPSGTTPQQLREIFTALGFEAVHATRSCALDRYTQICFRKR